MASFTNGTVIYGVIWTPSYRRIWCFLTIYAVIYVFYRNIRTVLQNVMTASTVTCTSLIKEEVYRWCKHQAPQVGGPQWC